MKDTGFIALLNDREYNPKNVGFMKDAQGRRGASCKLTIGNKDYAIWFMQKDFPKGIYVVALTKLQACMIFPMYKYIQTRNLQEVIAFVDSLKDGFDDSFANAEKITHPWTELSKRILSV
jgi:hypothetical protein